MNRLRAVVADDEPLARRLLEELLRRQGDVEVAANCANGAEALRALEEEQPDVLFLDIQMPELDGFEVLGRLPPARRPVVVFVTAYDRFAVRAFEVNAVDYLLKPFDEERLEAALGRVRTRLSQARPSGSQLAEVLAQLRPKGFQTRIAVHEGDRIFLLPVERIDWIEAAGKRVKIHSASRQLAARESIGALEENLDPQRFVRVSRSAIINIDRIREIQRWFQGQYILILEGGEKVTTTRTYRPAFDRVLKGRG
ncbi:MAG TPA: LytTR family DNA-binding domain-containing protein [Trueperaceae bacterium]